jgi:hypothetical protein
MSRRLRLPLLCLALCLAAGVLLAQRSRYGSRNFDNPRAAAESEPPPMWDLDRELPEDVFTFVRIQYSSGYGSGRWSRGGWTTDWPDAELNLSYRLQQLTAMKVHPNGKVLELTDPNLFNFPFIYIVEPGALQFSEEEVAILRRYLLNGGFLMVDDFWGENEYENLYVEMKRVFPEREPVELPMDHGVFNAVFPLKFTKNQMQVPNFRTGEESQYTGITWERSDARDVHIKGIFDDKGRMMAILCHNTDNGDGWEREGEYHYYFKEFSEKKAYPFMINILFYCMTH